MFPHQAQPHPQFNTNPYGGYPPNGASGYMPPQAPMYQQSPSTPPQAPMYQQPPPSAPPPPYSAHDPYNQTSTSSGLYPQFN